MQESIEEISRICCINSEVINSKTPESTLMTVLSVSFILEIINNDNTIIYTQLESERYLYIIYDDVLYQQSMYSS